MFTFDALRCSDCAPVMFDALTNTHWQKNSLMFLLYGVYLSVAVSENPRDDLIVLPVLYLLRVQDPFFSLLCWFRPTGWDQIIAEASQSEKQRKKRCKAAAVTELESLEVTGESGALWLARAEGLDGWTVLRLSLETVRWQAFEQRRCSRGQFCLRCNSQSEKPV